MIPLDKLRRLPRSQRLRKIWKIFADAENACFAGRLKNTEEKYCRDLLILLCEDETFSPAAQSAVKTALEEIDQGQIRRPLNTVRHLLLVETGRSSADWDLLDNNGNLDPSRRKPFPGMTVYLDDVRSPFNVGSIFRTAESFGVEKIFLSPLCASPHHPRAKRSAMGCVEILPWEHSFSLPQNMPVFALETGGLPLDKFPFPRRGIIVAGSEELGVSPRFLEEADSSLGRVSIPCYGSKGSLNVSVAFGIVMQAWAAFLRSENGE